MSRPGSRSLVEGLQLKRLVRRQQNFIVIAVAIYLALWAVDRPAEIGTTLIYTLPLCNLIVLVQDHLSFLYRGRHRFQSWAIYVSLVFGVAVAGVAIVNVIQFPAHKVPGQTLWQFVSTGWKLPFMATMIVGVSSELYRRTRERLESRNRELQQTIQKAEAESERYGQELEQAREIQQSLLPKRIPQIAGFEIAGAWEPARVVGGDYFDVIPLGAGRVGICVADVVGKSVSAALLMANVQASVRAFAADSPMPADLCGRVNSVLCSSIGAGKFVTLLYGVLDGERRTFSYASAGHPAPILMRGDEAVSRVEEGGAVLGVFPAWKYVNSTLELQPEDKLLLFTDGITEAGDGEGEEFGEKGLIQNARVYQAAPASELTTRLLIEVKQASAWQLRDDATLIVISALPLPSSKEVDPTESSLVGSGISA